MKTAPSGPTEAPSEPKEGTTAKMGLKSPSATESQPMERLKETRTTSKMKDPKQPRAKQPEARRAKEVSVLFVSWLQHWLDIGFCRIFG